MRHPLTLLAQPATLVFVALQTQSEPDDGLVIREYPLAMSLAGIAKN